MRIQNANMESAFAYTWMRRGYHNSHSSFRNIGVIPKNSDAIIELVSDFSKLIATVIKTKSEKNDSKETHYRKQFQMIK